MYNLSVNIGEAIGPIIGGGFTNFYSFDHACYFSSISSLFFFIIFAFYNYNKIKIEYSSSGDDSKDHNLSLDNYLLLGARRKPSMPQYSLDRKPRAFSDLIKYRKLTN